MLFKKLSGVIVSPTANQLTTCVGIWGFEFKDSLSR